MTNEKLMIHNRVGVQGQPVPVQEETFLDIPEEFHEDLVLIQQLATELGDNRHELGRLMQVVNHLITVCNTTDRNLTQSKQRIIEGMGLGEGNWAIDFSRKQVGQVSDVQKEVPRVV